MLVCERDGRVGWNCWVWVDHQVVQHLASAKSPMQFTSVTQCQTITLYDICRVLCCAMLCVVLCPVHLPPPLTHTQTQTCSTGPLVVRAGRTR